MAQPEASDEELYKLHHVRLVRLCSLLLADRAEGEEVAQEVFVRLFEQRRAGVQINQWGGWLTRVAVNACHDRRRSGWWKWWKTNGVELDPGGPMAVLTTTPEELVSRGEQRAEIWRNFAGLSPRQREIFVLRYLEGWSTDEVAQALDLDPSTVKRHLFRAVHHLRGALRGER